MVPIARHLVSGAYTSLWDNSRSPSFHGCSSGLMGDFCLVDVLFVSASLLPSFGYSPALPIAEKVGTGREKDLAAAGFNNGKRRSIQLPFGV